MISPFSFCSLLHKVSNWEGALDLNRSRIAQVNLVKSSTTIIMYIFPPRDFVLVGPIRSMCKSSRGLVVAVVNVAGCYALDFFFSKLARSTHNVINLCKFRMSQNCFCP